MKQHRPTSDPERRKILFDNLGKMNDSQLAAMLGIRQSAVSHHRNRLGIPPFNGRVYYRWNDKNTKAFIAYYVDHTKQECADKYGFTLSYVQCLLTIFRKRGYYVPYELN